MPMYWATFCVSLTPRSRSNNVQSNFDRSNSPVSNTGDRANSFVGPGNFPIHLMLKYTPGSNSDGSNSNSKHGPHGDFFHVKSYDGSNQIFLFMNKSHA